MNKEVQLRFRTSIAAVVAVVSSFALFAPTAHASGVCYSVQVTVNGGDVVNEAGCQDLP